jgi:hypothetical protein
MEIHLWPIPAFLVDTSIVHTELDDFTKASTLFPKIYHNANTAPLCTLDSLAQSED